MSAPRKFRVHQSRGTVDKDQSSIRASHGTLGIVISIRLPFLVDVCSVETQARMDHT